MLLTFVRWLARNFSTLLLAFILSVVVWTSAVLTADPNKDAAFQAIPLQVEGLDPSLTIVGEIPPQATLTLKAPQSIWNQLNNNPKKVRAWIDLSGLGAGEHTVPVKTHVDINPVLILSTDPGEVQVTLEPFVKRNLPVELTIDGDPPLGYRAGSPEINPAEVTVSGRQTSVDQVAQVHAALSIAGAGETVKSSVPLQALDKNGDPVTDVIITPKVVSITQPVNLLGGFKTVVIKPVTNGKLASGYRLTNISVTPLSVTVFSSNPQFINELPGYVETKPIDITGLNDDIDIRAELNLPPEITLVGEQSVLVQIGVAAIEGSLTVSLPIEAQGLPPEQMAHISPSVVDVIVTGPLPVLDTLTPASFRAVVQLNGMGEGTYPVQPMVDLVPAQVQVQSILPETVEVTISPAPTATPTPTLSPFASPRPTATRTPTPTPLTTAPVTATPTQTNQP